MKEERILVLNMLNDGKITADEACKLLSVLNGAQPEKERERERESGEFSEKVNKYADDIKKKVTKLAKDAEPTVKKYAEAVGDKIEDIRSGIKSKRKNDVQDEEIIIVDETDDSEAEDNSNEGNAQ